MPLSKSLVTAATCLLLTIASTTMYGNRVFAETVIAKVPVGDQPVRVAVNPRTNRVYVTGVQANEMQVIDGRNNTLLVAVTLPAPAGSPAVNPLTNQIYVPLIPTDGSDRSVAVVDGGTNRVVGTIATGGDPVVAAVNPFTNRIYVTNLDQFPGSIFVIDGKTDTVVANVTVGAFPVGVDVNPFTNRVYVVNEGDGTLSVIDGENNTTIATTSIAPPGDDDGLVNVAVDVATNRIYALQDQGSGDTVIAVNGADNSVLAEAPAGAGESHGLAVNPFTNRIYVTNQLASMMTVLDGKSNAISESVAVGSGPAGVAVNPFTGRIFVALQNVGQVAVVQGPTPERQ